MLRVSFLSTIHQEERFKLRVCVIDQQTTCCGLWNLFFCSAFRRSKVALKPPLHHIPSLNLPNFPGSPPKGIPGELYRQKIASFSAAIKYDLWLPDWTWQILYLHDLFSVAYTVTDSIRNGIIYEVPNSTWFKVIRKNWNFFMELTN